MERKHARSPFVKLPSILRLKSRTLHAASWLFTPHSQEPLGNVEDERDQKRSDTSVPLKTLETLPNQAPADRTCVLRSNYSGWVWCTWVRRESLCCYLQPCFPFILLACFCWWETDLKVFEIYLQISFRVTHMNLQGNIHCAIWTAGGSIGQGADTRTN